MTDSNNFKAQLKAKDEKIAGLRAHIRKRDKSIAALVKENKNAISISDTKDKEIERLREDIDRLPPSQSGLSSILREEDVHIAGLEKEIKNAKEISDSKDQVIAGLQSELHNQNEAMRNMQTRFDKEMDKVKQKLTESQQLVVKERGSSELFLRESETEIWVRGQKIGTLEMECVARGRRIWTLEAKLALLRSEEDEEEQEDDPPLGSAGVRAGPIIHAMKRWIVRFTGTAHLRCSHFPAPNGVERVIECISMAEDVENRAYVAFIRLKKKATLHFLSVWLTGMDQVSTFELLDLGRKNGKGKPFLKIIEDRLASAPHSLCVDTLGLA